MSADRSPDDKARCACDSNGSRVRYAAPGFCPTVAIPCRFRISTRISPLSNLPHLVKHRSCSGRVAKQKDRSPVSNSSAREFLSRNRPRVPPRDSASQFSLAILPRNSASQFGLETVANSAEGQKRVSSRREQQSHRGLARRSKDLGVTREKGLLTTSGSCEVFRGTWRAGPGVTYNSICWMIVPLRNQV